MLALPGGAQGIKWSAAKWMHVAHYAADGEVPVEVKQHVQEVVGPGGCKDAAGAECEAWALAGECTKNPGKNPGVTWLLLSRRVHGLLNYVMC